jgi:carboxypeptidase C (cathepsin A)
LPYILYLPTYTAAAWYHKKLPADLQRGTLEKAIQSARDFAGGEYTRALMKGNGLTPTERSRIAEQTAHLTGLSKEYIDQSNLRISIQRFRKELLRDEQRTIGRYDSRLEGTDADSAGERPEYDPSYASVQGAFTAAFDDYVRQDLKWETDLTYEVLTDKVRPWSYEKQQNQYVNTGEMLRRAMAQNPNLRVLVANGFYDLATPFFATEYTFSHLALDPSLQGNVRLMYCDAGHMLYTYKPCLDSLRHSIEEFYGQALSSSQAEPRSSGASGAIR